VGHTTTIAGKDVPIEAGAPTTVHFSAGRLGKREAGVWEFWTVFNDRAFIARCRQGTDPGERFRRMEDEPGYEEAWKVAATAKGIRPATQDDVMRWLNGHEDDAKFAHSCKIGSKPMAVVTTASGFRLK